MSAFRDAARRRSGGDFIVCPKCHAVDLVQSSTGQVPTPTIEPEPGGGYSCTVCGHAWTPTQGELTDD
jgi:hypothetical protein